jgi:predicted ATP-dependent endonuclease of OLD family
LLLTQGQTLKIEEITIQNFRSYRDAQKIEHLSSINAFVGPNGTGKSNVLETLKLLKRLNEKDDLGVYTEMVFDRNPNSEIIISLQFMLSNSEREKIITALFKKNEAIDIECLKKTPFFTTLLYSVTIIEKGIKYESIESPNILKDQITILRRQWEPSTAFLVEETGNLEIKCQQLKGIHNLENTVRNSGNAKPTHEILKRQHVPSPSESVILNILKEFIQGWEWFDPHREVTPKMDSGEESALHSSGDNLTKFMNSFSGINPRKFTGLADDVKEVLPEIEDIIVPLKERMATLKVKEKGLETHTQVDYVSYGYMQILILVIGIMTKKATLLMIEEPELHLHASAQRRLFRLIQKLSTNKQFFLTTHSTIFTGCDDKNSTYLFTKPSGFTKVTRVEKSEGLKSAKNVLGHRNVDLFGDECVVFIEGASEEVAFPIIAQSFGCDVCAKGINFVNVKGKDKFKKLEEYLGYLQGSGVISYVIADGSDELRRNLEDWQRAGIIKADNWTMWDLEFEDCFNSDLIAQAVNEMMKLRKVELELTAPDLDALRGNGVSIVKGLNEIFKKNNVDLDKPELAERLAILLNKESAKDGHQKTLPEKTIEKIIKLVDEKYDAKTEK